MYICVCIYNMGTHFYVKTSVGVLLRFGAETSPNILGTHLENKFKPVFGSK